jgi:hypothetical protein
MSNLISISDRGPASSFIHTFESPPYITTRRIMALPLPPGLTPPEIAFLCEMELVTVIPRQKLEGLELLGVCAPYPHPTIPCYTLIIKQRLSSDSCTGSHKTT